MIRSTAPPEDHAVVCCSLAVDDQVTVVTPGLTVRQADDLPDVSWQRRRCDHQRIDRSDPASLSGEGGRLAFRRLYDNLRLDKDPTASPFDTLSEAADKLS